MAQLSVIVTSYNIESYLEECLQSILDQTLQEIEIIVVDDGSSDDSPAIIRKFAEMDERIIPVLLEQNSPGGVATAANAGLDIASAPYVGFADGDDFLEPTMFEKLLGVALRHHTDLAMCQYKLYEDGTGVLSDPAEGARWSLIHDEVYPLDEETSKIFLRFIAVPWRKIYRRSMLEEHQIRFPVGDYFYEDNPFHWFSVLSSSSLAVVPEVLCYHRTARPGQTMQTADERLFKIFQHHDTIRSWLDVRGLTETYGSTLLAWAMSQMEWISQRTPKSLRAQLFVVLQDIYRQYPAHVVERALVEGGKGQTARRLSGAVVAGNLANFNQVLDTGSKTANPLVNAVYHLRYSGVSHTLWLAKRYLRQTLDRTHSPIWRRQSRQAVTNKDLMFAMVTLEERLDRLQGELRALRERQSESEAS